MMSSDLDNSFIDGKSDSVDDVTVLVFDSIYEMLSLALGVIDVELIALVVVVLIDVTTALNGGRNLIVDFDDFTSCTIQIAGVLASGKGVVFTGVVDLVRVILSITYRLFSFR